MKKISIIIYSLLLSGCVTMSKGGLYNQDVELTSDPPGAVVSLEEKSCVTPCKLSVTRGISSPIRIDFYKEGYDRITKHIEPIFEVDKDVEKEALWAALAVVPTVVDYATYSWFSYPHSLHAFLKKENNKSTLLIERINTWQVLRNE